MTDLDIRRQWRGVPGAPMPVVRAGFFITAVYGLWYCLMECADGIIVSDRMQTVYAACGAPLTPSSKPQPVEPPTRWTPSTLVFDGIGLESRNQEPHRIRLESV